LHAHISAHSSEFDSLIFSQSLFGITQNGVRLAPHNSLIQPCLHDEPPAALDPIQAAWRSARGILYYSHAERQIAAAKGLFNPNETVVGCGLAPARLGEPDRFRARHQVAGDYLLFVGKLSVDKNLPFLVDAFSQGLRSRGLTLVLAGTGNYRPPAGYGVRVIENLSDEDKRDAMAGALALVQPSLFESFSLVIMEAWQQNRPVIVHGDCAATTEHAVASGAGVAVFTSTELHAAIEMLRGAPNRAAAMGEAGAAYVAREFSWDAVCARYVRAIEAFISLRQPRSFP